MASFLKFFPVETLFTNIQRTISIRLFLVTERCTGFDATFFEDDIYISFIYCICNTPWTGSNQQDGFFPNEYCFRISVFIFLGGADAIYYFYFHWLVGIYSGQYTKCYFFNLTTTFKVTQNQLGATLIIDTLFVVCLINQKC